MKEIRNLSMQFDIEKKAEENQEEKMEIKGYAVVFNSPETYDYTEIIAPTAFDEADLSDVVLRYNHEEAFTILARTRNKSLNLSVDDIGLYMTATLQNDVQTHKDIYNMIKSKLIDKQSFAFTIEEDQYDYDTDTRTITKIGKVYDVSVVDQPFYNDTDVSVARNKNDEFLERRKQLREQHEKELEEQNKKNKLEERKKELLAKLG